MRSRSGSDWAVGPCPSPENSTCSEDRMAQRRWRSMGVSRVLLAGSPPRHRPMRYEPISIRWYAGSARWPLSGALFGAFRSASPGLTA